MTLEFGVGYFPTHDGMSPGEVARLVETYGQESLFFAEHTHIPASRDTAHPSGRPLQRKYVHTYDLFVALTAAASATTGLRVGSGICLVTERDPIVTAKAAARLPRPCGRSTSNTCASTASRPTTLERRPGRPTEGRIAF